MPIKIQGDLPVKEILEREGYEVISMDILPDDQVMLAGKLQEIADS